MRKDRRNCQLGLDFDWNHRDYDRKGQGYE